MRNKSERDDFLERIHVFLNDVACHDTWVSGFVLMLRGRYVLLNTIIHLLLTVGRCMV